MKLLPLLVVSGCSGALHRIAQVTEVTAYASTACDYGSTRSAMDSGNYVEHNMVLGPTPDGVTLGGYFALSESGIWFANRVLPDWVRVAVNTVVTIAEFGADRGNHAAGVAHCGL